MNNDSQGVNLGNPNNVIGSDMSSNNNGVVGVATPNTANGPVIPVVPIIDGSTQPSDNNTTMSAGISTPNIIMDSSNTVNNSNMNVSENTNSVNTTSDTASAINNSNANNGGIITVSKDSLTASVLPVSTALANEMSTNSSEAVASASPTLNFELPNNDTPPATPVANNINDTTTGSINPTGTEVSNSSGANNGVLPVSFNSILSEQNTNNSNGAIAQVTTPEVTATNNPVTPIDNAAVSQPSISSTNEVANVISVGKYLGHMLLFIIPVVGFIMCIVKAFDKKDKTISNFAKAFLIFSVIISTVVVVLSVLMFSLDLAAMNSANSDSATQVDDTYLYE